MVTGNRNLRFAAMAVVVMEFLEERNNGEKEGIMIFGIFSLTFLGL